MDKFTPFCIIGFLSLCYVCGWSVINNSCVFHQSKSYMDCSRRNLTFLPKIPKQTSSLNMSGNLLTSINQHILFNVSNIALTALDLSANTITTINKGSFSSFIFLKALNLSLNFNLSEEAIENATANISQNLETFRLEGLHLKHFPYESMPSLERTVIRELSVKNNSIKNVNTSKIFPYTTVLTRLDLSFNSLRKIHLSISESLGSLSLSKNYMTELPCCCDADKPLLTQLKALFVDDNTIRNLKMKRINCLYKLSTLNLTSNKIERIESDTFSQLTSLTAVILEKTEGLTHIEPNAFRSNSLQKVYLKENNIPFYSKNIAFKTFLNGCTVLTNLDISSNKVGRQHEYDWDMFSLVPDLTLLYMNGVDLLYLPSAIPRYLRELLYLSLDDNKIQFIPDGYFSPLKKLQYLALSGNKLTNIRPEDFPQDFVNHLRGLYLAYNAFVCNCNLVPFLKFAIKYKRLMYRYPQHYECSDGTLITGFLTPKSCLMKKEFSEIIKCTSYGTIFILSTISIIYRYRWRLRYMIYILGFRRRNYSNSNQSPYLHDIYISSSDLDFEIVYYQLVQELERKGYNVFFPERDSMPGKMVINESLDNMDRSKFVLLCLSDSYAQDNWCEFEACMALERSVYENRYGKDILAVVVLDEMNPINMTKVINKLLRSNEYILWDENMETRYYFWKKIENFLH